MRRLTIGRASTCVLLTLSSLFTITTAWPASNPHDSQFAKRQDSNGSPPQGSTDNEQPYNEEYDFIIAGGKFPSSPFRNIYQQYVGGTAGLVLANRLTESGHFSVLVLEAGPNPERVLAYESPGGNQFIKGSAIDWGLVTEPQVHLNNRTLQYLRGRALGGSSATNGLYYARGSASVYDHWVALGNPGWGFDSLLPYFKKMQTHYPLGSQPFPDSAVLRSSQGSSGPIKVCILHTSSLSVSSDIIQTSHNWWYSSLAEPFVKTLQSASFALNNDPDGGDSTGIINTARNIDPFTASRQDSVAAYLRAFAPSNVTVLVCAHARHVTFSNATPELVANGVEFQFEGKVFTVGAKKEVIICAGRSPFAIISIFGRAR